MAILGKYIDSRTIAGTSLAAGATSTFAHGLPAAPDFIVINVIATGATASNAYLLNTLSDATNVTIQNQGQITPPNFSVVSISAHSIIR